MTRGCRHSSRLAWQPQMTGETMITLTTYKWVPDFVQPLVRAFRVRWALEEAGMPYAVRHVELGPEQKSDEHLMRQPFGQVPAIEDDGLVLFESGAIALHIAEKSDALLPKDRLGRARAITWVFPALEAYRERCTQRPAFQRAMKAQLDGFTKPA